MRSLLMILIMCCFSAHAVSEKIPTVSLDEQLESFAFTQGRGEFTQRKFFKFLSKPIVSTGEFVVAKQDVLWQTNSPVLSQVLIKPTGIYRRLDTQLPYQQLTQAGDINQTLIQLMTGQISQSDWRILAANQGTCLTLEPINSQLVQLFNQAQLCKPDLNNQEITLHDKQGNKTSILMVVKTQELSQQDLKSLALP